MNSVFRNSASLLIIMLARFESFVSAFGIPFDSSLDAERVKSTPSERDGRNCNYHFHSKFNDLQMRVILLSCTLHRIDNSTRGDLRKL